MNKLKVKAAGQCSFKLSGFYLFSIGTLSKAGKLIPGFLFFIKWKFIQMLWEVLYDNRKLG